MVTGTDCISYISYIYTWFIHYCQNNKWVRKLWFLAKFIWSIEESQYVMLFYFIYLHIDYHEHYVAPEGVSSHRESVGMCGCVVHSIYKQPHGHSHSPQTQREICVEHTWTWRHYLPLFQIQAAIKGGEMRMLLQASRPRPTIIFQLHMKRDLS